MKPKRSASKNKLIDIDYGCQNTKLQKRLQLRSCAKPYLRNSTSPRNKLFFS